MWHFAYFPYKECQVLVLLITKSSLTEQSCVFSAVFQLRLKLFSKKRVYDTPLTFCRKAVSFVTNGKYLRALQLKTKTPFQMYTVPRLREFPENSYLSVNSNSLPTRLMLGKIALQLRSLCFKRSKFCMSASTESFFLQTESRHSTHIRHKCC